MQYTSRQRSEMSYNSAIPCIRSITACILHVAKQGAGLITKSNISPNPILRCRRRKNRLRVTEASKEALSIRCDTAHEPDTQTYEDAVRIH